MIEADSVGGLGRQEEGSGRTLEGDSAQTKGVLEANLRAGGFNVQVVEQELDWPEVAGTLGFLDL